ncbi:hypothetical protein ABW19_dt0203935 [Dactylella cylindrospora]|nr:hypothetical protein ABW19_dt0203935 [Dactylella cylindrospora]
MGYDSLPLEIELKILDDVEWTEVICCSQVCKRWRNYLLKSKARSRRYVPSRELPGSNQLGYLKNNHQHFQFTALATGYSLGAPDVQIANGDLIGDDGIIPENGALSQSPFVLLHRFMHGMDHSFGFFVRVDPAIPYAPLRNVETPQGFFLIGSEQLYLQANSLGGRRGSLVLPQVPTGHESESEESIDSEDEKGPGFNDHGRFSIQLNSSWHWEETLFDSPVGDTEIRYGRGFEDFRRQARAGIPNHRNGRSAYLRRLSELDFNKDHHISVRQLVDAVSKSVRTVKRLDPNLKENGQVYFIKFNGIRLKEYMKYIPHGFFDFRTGGSIELEIYDGVQWRQCSRTRGKSEIF